MPGGIWGTMTLGMIHSDGRMHSDLFECVSDGYRPLQPEIKQSKMITVLNSPQINVCYVTEPGLNSFLYALVLTLFFFIVQLKKKKKTPLRVHSLWCNLLAKNVNLSVSHLSQWWILLFHYFKPLSFIKVWHLFHRVFFCIWMAWVNTGKIKPLKWMTFQYTEPLVAKRKCSHFQISLETFLK